jgi:cytidine deaminase
MVSAGGRKIAAIAAVGGRDDLEYCAPCGGCRQRILEFADAHTQIVYMNRDGTFENVGIDELLPASFRL